MRLKITKWDAYWLLTIVQEVDKQNNNRYFLCECKCWVQKIIRLWHLRNWNIKSCWHLNIWNITHWLSYTRINKIYRWMKARCNDKNNKNYYWRWITYDKKWDTFEWFYEDMKEWYSDGLTLDRIDNNWNYSKENCRRATNKQQARNTRRNRFYNWKCLTEWCEDLWIDYSYFKRNFYMKKKNISQIKIDWFVKEAGNRKDYLVDNQ